MADQTYEGIAHRLFDAVTAECDLEEALSGAEVPYERLGWDQYDCSLELYGIPADYRLSEEVQLLIHKMGFGLVYVNHEDKWETHYNFHGKFIPVEGWRVSYPHKRSGEDTGGIWVEKHIPEWPAEWFESGYVTIKATEGE